MIESAKRCSMKMTITPAGLFRGMVSECVWPAVRSATFVVLLIYANIDTSINMSKNRASFPRLLPSALR